MESAAAVAVTATATRPGERSRAPRPSARRSSARRRRLLVAGVALLAIDLSACTTLGSLSPDAETRMEARRKSHRSQLLESSQKRRAAIDAATPDSQRAASELVLDGDRHRSAGNYSRAAIAYLRAHHADDDDLTPLRRIAYLALEREPSEAARLFRELLEGHPNEADLHLGLAMAQLARGEKEAALSAALRAHDLDPDSELVLDSLGLVYDRLGRHVEAREIYRRAVEVSGGAPGPLNNLGVSQMIARDYQAASQSFELAIERGASGPAIRNNLGLALGLAGHVREAYAQFAAAGTKGDAYNNLGLALFLRGDYEAAREAYTRALLAGDTDEERVLRNLSQLERQVR